MGWFTNITSVRKFGVSAAAANVFVGITEGNATIKPIRTE